MGGYNGGHGCAAQRETLFAVVDCRSDIANTSLAKKDLGFVYCHFSAILRLNQG